MTNIVTEVWRNSPKSPPDFVAVALRRETYRELLKASDFFSHVSNDDTSVSDTVDELLVAFTIAREEASGGPAHA